MTASNPVEINHRTEGSVFDDVALFSPAEGAELLLGLERSLKESGLTEIAAAKLLGVTQARVSDIKHGEINPFSLDLLVRLAARADLRPELRPAALASDWRMGGAGGVVNRTCSKDTPMTQTEHDELPAEIDFNYGVRGKFHRPGSTQRLNLPVHLDDPVRARLAELRYCMDLLG